ncbi:MAG: transposase family protein [Candidatus Gracilibacteria bacterium]|nr:transposase family protein [Candidatus Gracilibacteria bacterium]
MKKKLHTIKNIFITNENGEVIFLGKTRKGKIHDYKMLLKDDLANYLALDTPIFVDSAYIGMLKDFAGEEYISVSKKNTKLKKLTKEDKEFNTILGSIRVQIENTIGHVKRFKIVSNKLRNRIIGSFGTVKLNLKHKALQICSALQNLHKILA